MLVVVGLKVILGMFIVILFKWLVDCDLDMFVVDVQGQICGFGLCWYYCFFSEIYCVECCCIVMVMVEWYGEYFVVVMWQIDNEYGCYDMIESYFENVCQVFWCWLEMQYGKIVVLNIVWGMVFWSQEYRFFDEVDLLVGMVIEFNLLYVVDFQCFSFDQVCSFNDEQVEILWWLSFGCEIIYNFMGGFMVFDYYVVGVDIDVVIWDSYLLGFFDILFFFDVEKWCYLCQGYFDFQVFYYDFYCGCLCKWGVMEQQLGFVNWVFNNLVLLDGMVCLWSFEVFVYGVDLVSWFCW